MNHGNRELIAQSANLIWREEVDSLFSFLIMEEVKNQEEEVIQQKQIVSGLKH